MVCKKCGAEIESGRVYCPKCGESIQLVPNYDVFEEELLSRVVEDKDKAKDKSKDERFATGVYKPVAKPIQKQSSDASKTACSTNFFIRKKSFIQKLVMFLVIVTIGLFLIIPYLGSHSYDNVMNKAIEAETNMQYAKALGYFEEAYELDSESYEAIYGLGRMFYRVKEYEEAVSYLKLALEQDPLNKTIYTYLVECYDRLNDSKSLLELAEAAPNDDIAEIFAAYVVLPPELNLEGGDYKGTQELELSSSGDYQIFYTLDGKNPTTSGKKYIKPIKLTEGTYELKAVCQNKKGECSDIVSQTYNITKVSVAMPVVSPEPGTYTEQINISIAVEDGCKAYYTWDGTNPSEIGILYTEPFPVLKGSSVLSVVAIDSNGNASKVFHGEYNYPAQ